MEWKVFNNTIFALGPLDRNLNFILETLWCLQCGSMSVTEELQRTDTRFASKHYYSSELVIYSDLF